MAKTFERGLGDGVVRKAALRDVAGNLIARCDADRQSLRDLVAAAAPPVPMAAAPVAPARGPMALVDDYGLTRGGMQVKVGAHWVAMGPIGEMVGKALIAHNKAKGGDAPFTPPFTYQHIQIANEYIALTEARAAAGVKCASAEAGREGGGGGGFIDAYMDAGLRLAALQGRIGDGLAMDVRRSLGRDAGRSSVSVRALVDMVCLQGRDLSGVLRAHGWAPKGAAREALRVALAMALDRMARIG